MRFSLIMCTLGRRDEIIAFFESLRRQKRNDFEMIVVDQNSDDRLVDVLAKYSSEFPLKHVRMNARGASRARNFGIPHAVGELICFPDDDCEYLDGYLDRIDELFNSNPDVHAITSKPTSEPSTILNDEWKTSGIELDRRTVLDRCLEFTIVVRRSSLGSVRFNPYLGVGSGTPWGADEAPDFLIGLMASGKRVFYFPPLFVYHPKKPFVLTRARMISAIHYSGGRGCLLRLHHVPLYVAAQSLLRSFAGSIVALLILQPHRSVHFLCRIVGLCRGLLVSRAELQRIRDASADCSGSQGSEPVAAVVNDLPQINASSNVSSGVHPQPLSLPPLPSRPLVSVLVTNYNYAKFLPVALDSLINQTYENWEAVVCDDGSTDGSPDVVRRYAFRDPRIRLIEKVNGGQNSAVNECYRHLRGEVICLLDADDFFAPEKISRVVQAFIAQPGAGFCHHFAKVVDKSGEDLAAILSYRLDSGWLGDSANKRGACVFVPTTSSMSFRKEILAELMPIPEMQPRDADGYLAMAVQFLTPLALINEKLTAYRVHGNNMGGLTEPTPQRLRYELELIGTRTATLRWFLTERFGKEFAQQISKSDNPQYIQAGLKLHAVARVDADVLEDAKALIKRHPNAKWRAVWKCIFAVPQPMRGRLIPMIHGSHRFKAAIQRRLVEPAARTTSLLQPQSVVHQ